MFNALSQVNWLAVLLASVATFLLGAVWYTALFGKLYAASLGRNEPPGPKPKPIFIVGPFLCNAMVNVTDAVLLRALRIVTYGDALTFGAMIGLGYLAAMTMNIAINPNFPRPFLYTMISGTYFFLGSLIVCTILVAMP